MSSTIESRDSTEVLGRIMKLLVYPYRVQEERGEQKHDKRSTSYPDYRTGLLERRV